jgi:hypothetical protein
MYIEEAKKERFVSFTGKIPKSSQRSDWMSQFDCIIVYNHASVALWLTAASLRPYCALRSSMAQSDTCILQPSLLLKSSMGFQPEEAFLVSVRCSGKNPIKA